MNTSSYFISNKALFGSYPSQDAANELENNGVKIFVNLTEPEEKISPYEISPSSSILNYPIKDRKIPYNTLTFSLFLIKLHNIILNLKNSEKIYIHCRGGHGRAGVVVASYLCYAYNIDPHKALELTTEYHSDRKEMRAKWREIGSPQTKQQKLFVIKLFSPINFYKSFKSGPTTGFSNFSSHSIYIKELNSTFPTAEAAYHAFKNPSDTEYMNKLRNSKTPFVSKDLGKKIIPTKNWYDDREKHMETILSLKVKQHLDFKNNLIHSYHRKIIYHTKHDKFWGDGEDESGQNKLGKLLMKIRHKLFLNLLNN